MNYPGAIKTENASAAGVQLDAGASSVNGAHAGDVFKSGDESKVILSYDGTTKWAIVQSGSLGSPFASPPSAGAAYEITPLGLVGAATNTAGEVSVASASAVVIATEVTPKNLIIGTNNDKT